MTKALRTIGTFVTAALLGASLLCVPARLEAAASSTKDPLALIQEDFEKGTISLDQRAILVAQAVRTPEALPLAYQSGLALSSERYVTRDVTMYLKEIYVNWDLLSDSTQKAVQNILTRWSTNFTYVSPGGFFRLHYDTTGTTNKVPSADADHDGIPDYVEWCASYCDSSLDRQLGLGYIPPPSDGSAGGDSKYDVYFENMGYYGYTQPESPGPQPWADYTSYLVLHNNFLGFPPNTDPEGDQKGAAKVTCAHEFHHAIQMAYSLNQPGWYMEEDATSMETIVFPHTNDNYNYLPDFFTSPSTSLMDNSIHEYACFIWGLYLIQKFDTSLTVAAWQGARYQDIFAVVSDTLQARYGWTQDSAFADFTVWNYCTGSRNDGLHYSDASNYPLISIGQTHTTFPVNSQTSPTLPGGYAATYIQFIPTSISGKLRVSFDGADTRQWAAYVIKSTTSNSHEVQKIPLNQTTWDGYADVFGVENAVAITLVGINLSENTSGASFTYSAQVLQPYQMAGTILTDSSLYSGNSRPFKYKVKNTTTVSEIIRTAWSDQSGWVVKDSTSKFLVPGDSLLVTVNVKPPVATPIGTTSELQFRSVCLNDPSLVEVDSITEAVTLYRGDCNFDGKIDSGDLAVLVAYLSTAGLPPVPSVSAGDFNCSGVTDGTDLAFMVSYLTSGGAAPPCNPF